MISRWGLILEMIGFHSALSCRFTGRHSPSAVNTEFSDKEKTVEHEKSTVGSKTQCSSLWIRNEKGQQD